MAPGPERQALLSVLACIAAAVVALLVLVQRFRPTHKLPPGRMPWPISLVFLGGMAKVFAYTGAGPVKTRLLHMPTALVKNYEQLKELLNATGDIVEAAWPPATKAVLGSDSLLYVSGARHRMLRRLLGPCFAPQAIDACLPAIQEICERYCTAWADATAAADSSRAAAATAAASAAATAVATATVAATAVAAGFGAEVDAAAAAATSTAAVPRAIDVELLPKMQKEARMLTFEVMAHVVAGFSFTPAQLDAISEDFDKLTRSIFSPIPFAIPGTAFARAMAARRAVVAVLDEQMDAFATAGSTAAGGGPSARTSASGLPASASAAELAGGGGGGGGGRSVLERLLGMRDEEGKPLSRKALQDLTITLLFAGHETTATSILRLLLRLRTHPEVVAKLREEQEAAVRVHGGTVTGAALRDMPYLDAVIKETWRVDAAVPIAMRKSLRDFKLGGYDIPKGWTLVLGITAPIRESPMWQGIPEGHPMHPSAFNPDRWRPAVVGEDGGVRVSNSGASAAAAAASSALPSPSTSPSTSQQPPPLPAGMLSSPLGLLPPQMLNFGGGARYCLGANLSWAEIKAFMCVLLRRYDFSAPLQDMHVKTFPTTTITGGFPLEVRPRSATAGSAATAAA